MLPDDPLAIAEYRPGSAAVLPDAVRWPTMSAAGAARLARWRAHPDAPAWVHATGDRLDDAAAARVRRPLPTQGWLEAHLDVARRLPAYRRRSGLSRLADFPLVSRDDLVRDIAGFVPLDADLGRLVHGTSSGSTGHALQIPDDLEDTARTFHLMRRLARAAGVTWQPDPARAALATVVHQRQAFTYVGSISSWHEASMARLNLHPDAWQRGAAQRDAFLRHFDPQVVSGDPVALASLIGTPVRPLALFSSAMHLEPALRASLESAFGVPVFDVYGLHETRPIAVRTDDGPFRVLDVPVHVEVVDPQGAPVPDGVRGEIVVTAGQNPLLPLVRYRTGDHGALSRDSAGVWIHGLEARDAVVFRRADGVDFPCVDVTQQLQACGAVGWAVQQRGDDVRARVVGGDIDRAARVLSALFGRRIDTVAVPSLGALGAGKPRRYLAAHDDPSAQ